MLDECTNKPTVYVIAGPNGAGKTTFATTFLPDFVDCRQFLNADLIAAGLSVVAVVKGGDFPLADMLEQEGCTVTMFGHAARG